MNWPREKSNEKKIKDQIDANILEKLAKTGTLTDNEENRLTSILKNNNINKWTLRDLDTLIVLIGLIIFAYFLIHYNANNQTILTIATTAIGGVIGYLAPKN